MFLNFINFFKRFIFQYFEIVAFLINLLKNNKNEKKKLNNQRRRN